MRHVYNGRWGTTWVVTIGPVISLPLGLLAHLTGVSVVVSRLYVLALVAGCFIAATRIAGLKGRFVPIAALIFILWVACMPWRPTINGSSFNLIANVFGEGSAFGFALLANLLAAKRGLRSRSLAWIFALFAVGSKTVAVVAVVAPLAYIVWDTLKTRSWKSLGWPGLLAALGIFGAWQAWQAYVLGWPQFIGEWSGFFFWLNHGGGYAEGLAITLGSKWAQLQSSYVQPSVLIALCLVALGFIARFHSLAPRGTKMVLASTIIFFSWWILLSSRGWMRHLWVGYAMLGWLLAITYAQLIAKYRARWLETLLLASVLAVVAFFHGSLKALGPLNESARWATQKKLADELQLQYPKARLFVPDWHFVPQVAFFQRKPQNNLEEIPIRPGDLVLCDLESSACEPQLFSQYCVPKMTSALTGYCVYGLAQ